MAEEKIKDNLRLLDKNTDTSMLRAAAAAISHSDTLPNSDFYIHESSPSARGTGRAVNLNHMDIQQFLGDAYQVGGTLTDGDGASAAAKPTTTSGT